MTKNFLFTLLIASSLIKAQEELIIKPDTTTFFTKKNISIITLSAVLAGSLYGAYVVWWKDDFGPFRFYSGDWLNDTGLNGIDKVGHFYTSYLFYHLQKDLLLWGGHSEEFAFWTSTALTSFFALIVEVGDAFTPYGFDYQDLTFNIGGLGYGILQDNVDFFKNFDFKWSYFPKHKFSFPPKLSEDYDGHIYWLSIDIHNLLKSSVGRIWPEFLRPAIGFSVEDNGNRREFILGFDFNLYALFGSKDENWNLLVKSADHFHIPAPGIKFPYGRKPDYRGIVLN
jgi:hypothetical protein